MKFERSVIEFALVNGHWAAVLDMSVDFGHQAIPQKFESRCGQCFCANVSNVVFSVDFHQFHNVFGDQLTHMMAADLNVFAASCA